MKKFARSLAAFSLFLGSVMAWEEFTQFLSLGSLTIRTEAPAAELLLWKSLAPEELRYWPIFLYRSGRLQEKIESELPVLFMLSRDGASKFFITLEPLRPYFVVRWKERSFYLTREGRIWDTAHPANGMLFPVPDLSKSPPFVLADMLPPPAETSGDGSMVTESLFPAGLFAEWLDGLESNGWLGQTRQIAVSKREGKYLLRLNMNIAKKAVSVLLWGERSRWREISSAVSQILNQLQLSGGDIIIDATYSDRVIVRSGKEGSGK